MSRKTILPNIAYDTQRRSYYVTIRRPPEPGAPPRRPIGWSRSSSPAAPPAPSTATT